VVLGGIESYALLLHILPSIGRSMLTSLHFYLLSLQGFVLLANYVADDLRVMLASFDGVLNVAIHFDVALLLFFANFVFEVLLNFLLFIFYCFQLLLHHAFRKTLEVLTVII